MNPDQVYLLTEEERSRNSNYATRINSHFASTTSKLIRKNILLVILCIFITTCLSFYFYLNLVAIDENQSDPARYKPLSRRKPMLDHESIFSDSGPSMIQLNDLLAHCIVALQIAGKQVVQMSLLNNDKISQVGSKGKTRQGADDIVTGADMKSHKMILSTIKDSYRRLRIVSEEDTTKDFENLRHSDNILPVGRSEFAGRLRNNLHEIEKGQRGHGSLIAQHETLVWIDPLDATKEYSENLTDYVTLMACVVHKGVSIAGVIHKPFVNRTYWSIIDEPTWNTHLSSDLQNLIQGSGRKSDGDNLGIIISRSHAGDIKKVLEQKYGDKVSIVAAGGSGYKTLELLAGKVDAYVHMTQIKKWDICAPQAIISAIKGANLTDLAGNQINFGNAKDKVAENGLIATLRAGTHRRLIKSFEGISTNK